VKVKLIDLTDDAEGQIIYIARVSNPSNQDNPEYAKLLKYCINHQHWSVFEHAHMSLEIETSLAIATQILRHRSFTFQQFSQRYANAAALGFEAIELRQQAEKNRQSSTDKINAEAEQEFLRRWSQILEDTHHLYHDMIEMGVAKECARFILPQCTQTRLYMTGNIRSWIHYLQLRTGEDVQKEHRQVALTAQKIFISELPVTAQALGWANAK
jgi:thymidylate synthase (FAD)